ncbi:MAG: hypothetical protein IJW70_01290 [Clostridia bacterium]|nr:hypothetical protein [Clostridia bacterium]
MTQNTIAITEIWEQIKKLQEQLTSLNETADRMTAVSDTDEFEGGEHITSVNTEIALAKIDAVKQVFIEREKTLQSLLELYKNLCAAL